MKKNNDWLNIYFNVTQQYIIKLLELKVNEDWF